MTDFMYEITGKFGSLSPKDAKWPKELRLISWNGKAAKYDIREWAPLDQKMGKGITFTKEELIELRKILNKLDL